MNSGSDCVRGASPAPADDPVSPDQNPQCSDAIGLNTQDQVEHVMSEEDDVGSEGHRPLEEDERPQEEVAPKAAGNPPVVSDIERE